VGVMKAIMRLADTPGLRILGGVEKLIPPQHIMMPEPGIYRTGAWAGWRLIRRVEFFQVFVCPLWLARDGEKDVRDVGGLQQKRAPAGAIFRHNRNGTKA